MAAEEEHATEAEEEARMALAFHIKRLAVQEGFSDPQDLAYYVDIGRTTIYKAAAGQRMPTIRYVAKIAQVYGVQVWQLLKPPTDAQVEALDTKIDRMRLNNRQKSRIARPE